MNKLVPYLFMLLAICLCHAVGEYHFGGMGEDLGYAILQDVDSCFVIVGQTASFGDARQVYIIKTDADGETLWTRCYGGSDWDLGRAIVSTPYGGFAIAGCTKSFGASRFNFYIIRMDGNGDTLWTRAYGDVDNENCYAIVNALDGGFILVGETQSFGGDYDAYLIKVDADGELVWTRVYGGEYNDGAYSIAKTADGGYIVVGFTDSYAPSREVWLLKLDINGDTLWTKAYGGYNEDFALSVGATSEGFIIVGYSNSFGMGGTDVYLIKIDAFGDTLWTKTYGGIDYDAGYCVSVIDEREFAVVGYTASFGEGGTDVYLLRLNAHGDTLWTETYGFVGSETGRFICQTYDGGYAITGWTNSFGAMGTDIYLVYADSTGSSAIATNAPVNGKNVIEVFPNPFNSSCMITFDRQIAGKIDARIMDINGRIVDKLSIWGNSTIWTPGENVCNGIYFITIAHSGWISCHPVVFLK